MLRNVLTRFGIVRELFSFLWKRKLWWLLPMVTMLLITAVLLLLAQGAASMPFIYTLF